MSSSSSRIPGFYRLGIADRRHCVAQHSGVADDDLAALARGGIDLQAADGMIENVIGTYALPLGVALNFTINGRDYLVPMAIEEPSVVAAASNAARMVRDGGGFQVETTAPVMIAQVQLLDVADPIAAAHAIDAAVDSLLADARGLVPRLVERGGGPVGVETRVLSRPGDPDGGMLVVHLLVDCRDAMGANIVNTLAEGIGPRLAELANARLGLRILSNLCDRRLVRARARVGAGALGGPAVRDAIASASRFAELDPYRAATHNKGIMNGIDAVLLATGQDWRGVEAGAHAYAARAGAYRPLATWRTERGNDHELVGELELPLAVGTVGGAVQAHDGARAALAVLGAESATELASVAAAVGLASNLAALRALATEGIQRGHMSLHARMVARAAGATGELVDRVAAALNAEGELNRERAREILATLRDREETP